MRAPTVILSAAKNLRPIADEILRCAQDDMGAFPRMKLGFSDKAYGQGRESMCGQTGAMPGGRAVSTA